MLERICGKGEFWALNGTVKWVVDGESGDTKVKYKVCHHQESNWYKADDMRQEVDSKNTISISRNERFPWTSHIIFVKEQSHDYACGSLKGLCVWLDCSFIFTARRYCETFFYSARSAIWRYQLLNYLLSDRRSECKLGKIDRVRLRWSVRVGVRVILFLLWSSYLLTPPKSVFCSRVPLRLSVLGPRP